MGGTSKELVADTAKMRKGVVLGGHTYRKECWPEDTCTMMTPRSVSIHKSHRHHHNHHHHTTNRTNSLQKGYKNHTNGLEFQNLHRSHRFRHRLPIQNNHGDEHMQYNSRKDDPLDPSFQEHGESLREDGSNMKNNDLLEQYFSNRNRKTLPIDNISHEKSNLLSDNIAHADSASLRRERARYNQLENLLGSNSSSQKHTDFDNKNLMNTDHYRPAVDESMSRNSSVVDERQFRKRKHRRSRTRFLLSRYNHGTAHVTPRKNTTTNGDTRSHIRYEERISEEHHKLINELLRRQIEELEKRVEQHSHLVHKLVTQTQNATKRAYLPTAIHPNMASFISKYNEGMQNRMPDPRAVLMAKYKQRQYMDALRRQKAHSVAAVKKDMLCQADVSVAVNLKRGCSPSDIARMQVHINNLKRAYRVQEALRRKKMLQYAAFVKSQIDKPYNNPLLLHQQQQQQQRALPRTLPKSMYPQQQAQDSPFIGEEQQIPFADDNAASPNSKAALMKMLQNRKVQEEGMTPAANSKSELMKILQNAKSQEEDMLPSDRIMAPAADGNPPYPAQLKHLLDVMHEMMGKGVGQSSNQLSQSDDGVEDSGGRGGEMEMTGDLINTINTALNGAEQNPHDQLSTAPIGQTGPADAQLLRNVQIAQKRQQQQQQQRLLERQQQEQQNQIMFDGQMYTTDLEGEPTDQSEMALPTNSALVQTDNLPTFEQNQAPIRQIQRLKQQKLKAKTLIEAQHLPTRLIATPKAGIRNSPRGTTKPPTENILPSKPLVLTKPPHLSPTKGALPRTPSRSTPSIKIPVSSLPRIPGPLKNEYKSFDFKPTKTTVGTRHTPSKTTEVVPTKAFTRATVPTVAVDRIEPTKANNKTDSIADIDVKPSRREKKENGLINSTSSVCGGKVVGFACHEPVAVDKYNDDDVKKLEVGKHGSALVSSPKVKYAFKNSNKREFDLHKSIADKYGGQLTIDNDPFSSFSSSSSVSPHLGVSNRTGELESSLLSAVEEEADENASKLDMIGFEGNDDQDELEDEQEEKGTKKDNPHSSGYAVNKLNPHIHNSRAQQMNNDDDDDDEPSQTTSSKNNTGDTEEQKYREAAIDASLDTTQIPAVHNISRGQKKEELKASSTTGQDRSVDDEDDEDDGESTEKQSEARMEKPTKGKQTTTTHHSTKGTPARKRPTVSVTSRPNHVLNEDDTNNQSKKGEEIEKKVDKTDTSEGEKKNQTSLMNQLGSFYEGSFYTDEIDELLSHKLPDSLNNKLSDSSKSQQSTDASSTGSKRLYNGAKPQGGESSAENANVTQEQQQQQENDEEEEEKIDSLLNISVKTTTKPDLTGAQKSRVTTADSDSSSTPEVSGLTDAQKQLWISSLVKHIPVLQTNGTDPQLYYAMGVSPPADLMQRQMTAGQTTKQSPSLNDMENVAILDSLDRLTDPTKLPSATETTTSTTKTTRKQGSIAESKSLEMFNTTAMETFAENDTTPLHQTQPTHAAPLDQLHDSIALPPTPLDNPSQSNLPTFPSSQPHNVKEYGAEVREYVRANGIDVAGKGLLVGGLNSSNVALLQEISTYIKSLSNYSVAGNEKESKLNTVSVIDENISNNDTAFAGDGDKDADNMTETSTESAAAASVLPKDTLTNKVANISFDDTGNIINDFKMAKGGVDSFKTESEMEKPRSSQGSIVKLQMGTIDIMLPTIKPEGNTVMKQKAKQKGSTHLPLKLTPNSKQRKPTAAPISVALLNTLIHKKATKSKPRPVVFIPTKQPQTPYSVAENVFQQQLPLAEFPLGEAMKMDDMYWTDSRDEIELTCKEQKGTEIVINILAFGDSLTRGYYNNGRGHHPYTMKLQYLLNNFDPKRCFIIDNEGKDGEPAFGEMPKRMEQVLSRSQVHYNWAIILGGTNDIYNKILMRSGRHTAKELSDNIISIHELAQSHGIKTVVVTIPEVYCKLDGCQDMKEMREEVNKDLRLYATENKSKTLLCDIAGTLARRKLDHKLAGQVFEGGLHLRPRGYETMARLLFESFVDRIYAT